MIGKENAHIVVIEEKKQIDSEGITKGVVISQADNIIGGAIRDVLRERGFTGELVAVGEGVIPRVLRNPFPTDKVMQTDKDLIDAAKGVIARNFSKKDTSLPVIDQKEKLRDNEIIKRDAPAHEEAIKCDGDEDDN